MVLLPHFPKIISNKTEVLLVSTASTPTKSQKFSINVDNCSILLSPQVSHFSLILITSHSLPTSTWSPSFPHPQLLLSLSRALSLLRLITPLFGLSDTFLHKLFQSPLARIITHSLQRAHHSCFSTASLAAGRF